MAEPLVLEYNRLQLELEFGSIKRAQILRIGWNFWVFVVLMRVYKTKEERKRQAKDSHPNYNGKDSETYQSYSKVISTGRQISNKDKDTWVWPRYHGRAQAMSNAFGLNQSFRNSLLFWWWDWHRDARVEESMLITGTNMHFWVRKLRRYLKWREREETIQVLIWGLR